jgi:hypothetical protein
VELELLGLDVEPQVAEGRGVALEERWRLAPDDPEQRRDALLPVEKQLLLTRDDRRATPNRLLAALGLPDEQRADRKAEIQRAHQPADLIAVPHVPALELRQEHRSRVDLVQDRAQLRHAVPLLARLRLPDPSP